LVTMSDVSIAAGVSTATVSRVINHPEIVDTRTRDKVQAAITALNYRRNEVARGLASQSSRTIGVVVMMEGVSVALREQGFHTIVESSNLNVDGERRSIDSLVSRQVDALIIYSFRLSDKEVGDEKIAMIEGHDFIDGTALRSKGFTDTLKKAGHPVSEDCILKGDFSFNGGYQAMRALINSEQIVTAVFAHNDQMAAGAIDACREAGISVPHDVSIVGFDDLDVAYYTSLEMMGRSAAVLAHSLATDKAASMSSHQRVFVPEIVERESVRKL